MERGKKAQSEILTTVLIILLVLAIAVILWKVVSGAVNKGAENIGAQEKCLGVMMEITQPNSGNDNEFSIKRADNKEIKEGVGLIVLVDGKPTTDYVLANGMTADDFKTPYTSSKITFTTPVTQKLEVALKIGENVCSSTTYEL